MSMAGSMVIAVCNLQGGRERASVSAHLAVTATRLGRDILLVDLDPDGLATRQIFGRHPSAPTVLSVLLGKEEAATSVRTLTIEIYSDQGPYVVETRMMSVATGGPRDIAHSLSRMEARELATRLRKLTRGLATRSNTLILDLPPPEDALARAALSLAGRVLVPLKASPLIENEVRSVAGRIWPVAGLRSPDQLVFTLVSTESAGGLYGAAKDALDRLFPEGRPVEGLGTLLRSEVEHDVGAYADRLEQDLREDWVSLAREALGISR